MSRSPLPRAALLAALAALAASFASACTSAVNTLPPVVGPEETARALELEVPANLEIRSVDFSAAMYGDVSGPGAATPTSTSVGGRAFVKVMAVDPRTRETFLLVYEDIERRRQPALVVRFRPTP